MITSLTREQLEELPVYRDKWIKIGLSCEPVDFEKAKAAAIKCYKLAGLQPPTKFYKTKGILSGVLALLNLEKVEGLDSAEKSSLTNLSPPILEKEGLIDQTEYLDCFFSEEIKSALDKLLTNGRNNEVRTQGMSILKNFCLGSHDAVWLSYYDYFKNVCELECCNVMDGLFEMAEASGWWYPAKTFALFTDRHSVLKKNSVGLHCEDGPAIAYRDGLEIYALNNVKVPKNYVMVPAEKMDPEIIVKETNVERRRELLRKIGVERWIQHTKAVVLDKKGTYELLSVQLDADMKDCRFLKMINPSIGVWHVEGVDPACATVQEAINWRKGGDKNKEWKPTLLT